MCQCAEKGRSRRRRQDLDQAPRRGQRSSVFFRVRDRCSQACPIHMRFFRARAAVVRFFFSCEGASLRSYRSIFSLPWIRSDRIVRCQGIVTWRQRRDEKSKRRWKVETKKNHETETTNSLIRRRDKQRFFLCWQNSFSTGSPSHHIPPLVFLSSSLFFPTT